MSRVGRYAGGASRTPGHRRDDLRGVGRALARGVRPAQPRIECPQCGRTEHPPGGFPAVGADRCRGSFGHRSDDRVIATLPTREAVSWQRPPPRDRATCAVAPLQATFVIVVAGAHRRRVSGSLAHRLRLSGDRARGRCARDRDPRLQRYVDALGGRRRRRVHRGDRPTVLVPHLGGWRLPARYGSAAMRLLRASAVQQ